MYHKKIKIKKSMHKIEWLEIWYCSSCQIMCPPPPPPPLYIWFTAVYGPSVCAPRLYHCTTLVDIWWTSGGPIVVIVPMCPSALPYWTSSGHCANMSIFALPYWISSGQLVVIVPICLSSIS